MCWMWKWSEGRKQEWILGIWLEQLMDDGRISWNGQDGGEAGFGKDTKSSSLALLTSRGRH